MMLSLAYFVCYCYVAYIYKQLGQTGGGHFSPIGAYNSEHDKVCVTQAT
jgi:Phytochelatin synthase